MEAIVERDILELLKETIKLLSQEHPNPGELKNISNRTVHNASIFQDEDSISFAVLMYSLSKVIERAGNYLDYDEALEHLRCGVKSLERENAEGYRKCLQGLFDTIKHLDAHYTDYIQDVFSQAAIKKGTHMYEHGVSSSRIAELLGISLWELKQYLGATESTDTDIDAASVRQRLAFTRGLFK